MSPFLCVLAFGAICFSVGAQDNSAQAAARMALAKQLFELNSQQATNAPPTNAATAPENKQDAKARARADKAAKAAAAARAKQDAAQAAADKKAKEEADKKLAAQQAAETKAAAAKAKQDATQAAADRKAQEETEKKLAAEQAAQAKAAAANAQAQAPAKPIQEPAAAPVAAPNTSTATGDNPAQAAARMALAGQLFEANQQPTAQPEAQPAGTKKLESGPVVVTPAPAPAPVVLKPAPTINDNNYPGKELGLKPIAAPALPINASKAQRLQVLLDQYRADQITPEEYHKQRAAILAGGEGAPAMTPTVVPATMPTVAKSIAISAGGQDQARSILTFDQDSGSAVTDASGNGNNATVSGDSFSWIKSANGDSGLKLGGSSFAEVPGAVVNTAQSFTVSAWVSLDMMESKKYQTFVSIDGNEISGFYLQLNPYAGGGTGRFEFDRYESDAKGVTRISAKARSTVTTNTWYHLVGVYNADAQNTSLYVDGKLQETVPYTHGWQATGKTAVGRGRVSGHNGNYMTGVIRDVRFYASALTQDQVKNLAP